MKTFVNGCINLDGLMVFEKLCRDVLRLPSFIFLNLFVCLASHRLGPLSSKPTTGGMLEYSFQLMAGESEKFILEPTSGTLLFSPPQSVLVGANNCVDTAVELHAEKGQLLEGQVTPPSAGIKITVTKGTADDVVFVTETAEDGRFKIGPLQGGVDYR
jgi:hypothetical protein